MERIEALELEVSEIRDALKRLVDTVSGFMEANREVAANATRFIASASAAFDVIHREGLVIKDGNGVPRLHVGMAGEQAAVTIHDERGKPKLRISENGIAILDRGGTPRIFLGTVGTTYALRLCDAKDKVRGIFGARSEAGTTCVTLSLHDVAGEARISAIVDGSEARAIGFGPDLG